MSQRIIGQNKTEKKASSPLALAPSVWVGKNGVNDSIVHELRQQLRNNKLVKVKILRSALAFKMDRKDIAQQLERLSGAPLIELKGYTAVYRSPSRNRKAPAPTLAPQQK